MPSRVSERSKHSWSDRSKTSYWW